LRALKHKEISMFHPETPLGL